MDWVRGVKLGHGSFATVSLAVPAKQSTTLLPPLIAVKSCGASLSSSLMTEKSILEQLKNCPEVIRCYGESSSLENGERLYNVLLEYAAGGSLADKIKNSGDRRLPEIEARRYTKALLRGLNYIHKFGYVHCDIKLQNILLCSDGGVKIADFGLAKRNERESVRRSELRGTPMYMSPEMVAGGNQGAPADIWALGCVVAEMVAGAPAWRCSDVAALLMMIGVGDELPEIPEFLSEEGKDFIGKCFVKDPTRRWTAEMLLNHPFVCGHDLIVAEDGVEKEKTSLPSTSPRCPFDFPEWTSSAACSITSLPSPGYFEESGSWFSDGSDSPLQELISEQCPDWSVADDWITVR